MHVNVRRGLSVLACLLAAAVFSSSTVLLGQEKGILESALDLVVRPVLNWAALAPSLPTRGRFTFPAPYSTLGIRLTTSADCANGQDCVNSVGYSYWRNINNHAGSNTMLIALTLDRTKGGTGPTLFSYDKVSGVTRNLGALFPSSSALSWATGEGWYFSATRPTTLYLNDGSRVQRFDVTAKTSTTVIDLASVLGSGYVVWQVHSSNDDDVHSFTVRRTATGEEIGCGVYVETSRRFRLFPARGEFDECQVDKSGRYLLIKENVDGLFGLDNLIVDLVSGAETILLDQAGAVGHSDMGYGYVVGEDDWNAAPGAMRVWDFTKGGVTNGRVVFQTTDWAFGANHVSHANARADLPVERQVACSSSANRLPLPRANEIVCYRLDGSLKVLAVAPVMTNLSASGGGSDDYVKLPKGNLDVTGEYFLWTSNVGGSRLDAFMVQVPLGRLGVTTPTDPGTPKPPPPPPATAGFWTSLANATVTASGLEKTGGCDGCADATGASTKVVSSGNLALEFPAAGSGLRIMGLGRSNEAVQPAALPFSIRLSGAIAEVRELGVYRGETSIAPTDTLRIAYINGRVVYSRNGTVFHTSARPPVYAVRAAAVIYTSGGKLATPKFE